MRLHGWQMRLAAVVQSVETIQCVVVVRTRPNQASRHQFSDPGAFASVQAMLIVSRVGRRITPPSAGGCRRGWRRANGGPSAFEQRVFAPPSSADDVELPEPNVGAEPFGVDRRYPAEVRQWMAGLLDLSAEPAFGVRGILT